MCDTDADISEMFRDQIMIVGINDDAAAVLIGLDANEQLSSPRAPSSNRGGGWRIN